MDALFHEDSGVVDDLLLEARWKRAGQPRHLFPDPLGRSDGVGAWPLEDRNGDRLATVEGAGGVFILRAKFHPADVADADDLTTDCRRAGGRGVLAPGLDDHFSERLGLQQPTGGLKRHLKGDARFSGGLAEPAGRHLDVLFPQRFDHITCCEAAGGKLVGVKPDPHRIVAGPEKGDIANAVDPGECVLYLNQGIVAEVELVVAAIAREEIDAQQDARRFLFGHHALSLDLFGQFRLGNRHPVLGEHLGQVDIGTEFEGDVDDRLAVAGALRCDKEHLFDAVDLLFDRCGDGVGHHLGRSAGVNRLNGNRRWNDVGILANWQADRGDATDDHDYQREHRGEDRPVDEELADHGAAAPAEESLPAAGSVMGRTRLPSRARDRPEMMICSVPSRPCSITRSMPAGSATLRPISTG